MVVRRLPEVDRGRRRCEGVVVDTRRLHGQGRSRALEAGGPSRVPSHLIHEPAHARVLGARDLESQSATPRDLREEVAAKGDVISDPLQSGVGEHDVVGDIC